MHLFWCTFWIYEPWQSCSLTCKCKELDEELKWCHHRVAPLTSFLAVFNDVAIQASSSDLLWSQPLQAACAVCHIMHCEAHWFTCRGWRWQRNSLKKRTTTKGMQQVEAARIPTNRHEGFGGETGRRHANAVDSKHPHLIQDAFNHPLGLIRRWFVHIKVELSPSGGAFLLPLHEIAWQSKHTDTWAESCQHKHLGDGKTNESPHLWVVPLHQTWGRPTQ